MKRQVSAVDVRAFLAGNPGSDAVRRCVEALEHTPNIWRLGPVRSIRRLARKAQVAEGEMVVRVLRTFEPLVSNMPKAISETYQLLSRTSDWFDKIAAEELEESFRNNPGLHYRATLTYIADAQVALVEWVNLWNLGKVGTRTNGTA